MKTNDRKDAREVGRSQTTNPWHPDYKYPDPKEVVAPLVEEFKKDLNKIFSSPAKKRA